MTPPKALAARVVHDLGRTMRRHGVLLCAVALALIVPRALALRGVSRVDHLAFNDMPAHLSNANKLHQLRRHGDDPYFTRAPAQRRLINPARWPAGVYRVAGLFIGSFGPLSIWTTQGTNLLFLLLLLGAVAALGRRLQGPRLGLWAALLTALCPPLVASTWYFSLDFPLVAMIFVGLWALHATAGFSRLRRSLGLGLLSALGLWVKPTYALYLLLPSAWTAASGLRGRMAGPLVVARNLGLAAALTLALTAALSGLELGSWWQELKIHLLEWQTPGELAPQLNQQRAWSLWWFLAIPGMALSNLTLPLLASALPGLLALHLPSRPRRARGAVALLRSFVWGCYLALTLMTNKMERYVHPLYPALCLLIPWSITTRLPRRWQTPALLWVTAAFGATLVLVQQHPTPWRWGLFSQQQPAAAYEFVMPRRSELAVLRRRLAHSECRVEPLVGAMAALAGRGRLTRPLGVAFPGEPDITAVNLLRLTKEQVVLLASQRITDRLVFHYAPTSGGPPPPEVLLLHGADQNPRTVLPRMSLVIRQQLQLHCEEETLAVQISLLRFLPN